MKYISLNSDNEDGQDTSSRGKKKQVCLYYKSTYINRKITCLYAHINIEDVENIWNYFISSSKFLYEPYNVPGTMLSSL